MKPCRECSKDISAEALTCPNCGAPNPHGESVVEPCESKGVKAKGDKLTGVAAGTLFGLGCLIPAGILLCFTGIGALFGVPLIIAGLIAPLFGLMSIKGPCPYCGCTIRAMKTSEGVTCKACKKRVVVRGGKLYRVD